jgi:hypothetical protein
MCYWDKAAADLAAIRHTVLNTMRQEKGRKLSVPRKKMRADGGPSCLDTVLEAGVGVVTDK